MVRVLILGFAIALAIVACGDDSNRKLADAKPIDAPVDAMAMGSGSDMGSGSGSGSDFMTENERHPRDRQLELLVASLSLGVMVGPLLSLRRRRDQA